MGAMLGGIYWAISWAVGEAAPPGVAVVSVVAHPAAEDSSADPEAALVVAEALVVEAAEVSNCS